MSAIEILHAYVLQRPELLLHNFSMVFFSLRRNAIQVQQFASTSSTYQNCLIKHGYFLHSFKLYEHLVFPMKILQNLIMLFVGYILINLAVVLFEKTEPFFLEYIGSSILLIESLQLLIEARIVQGIRSCKTVIDLALNALKILNIKSCKVCLQRVLSVAESYGLKLSIMAQGSVFL